MMYVLKLAQFIRGFCIWVIFASTIIYCPKAVAQLTADFISNVESGCSPVVVSFTNTSKGISANTIFTWDLGNGNPPSNSVNPGAIYITPGTYTVTLTAKEGNISVSAKKYITVYQPPTADFNPSAQSGCTPFNVSFTATATAGSGGIKRYIWDFGDGKTDTSETTITVKHTYTENNDVSVSLTVTNTYGCTNAKEKPIQVQPGVKIKYDLSKNVLCNTSEPVVFTNRSTGAGVLNYKWGFGDNTFSNQKDPSHKFSNPGIYTVQLRVESSEGCFADSVATGLINVASFITDFSMPAQVCINNETKFVSTTSPFPLSEKWLVDGININSADTGFLKYIFTDIKEHTIKLVNDFGGCVDSAIKKVTVKQAPALNSFVATVAGYCGAPVSVNFKDTTTANDIVKWAWNFNTSLDLSAINATTEEANNYYTENGNFPVRLTIENSTGCTDTVTKIITVKGPDIDIISSDAPAKCGPYSLNLSAKSNDLITNYKWSVNGKFISAAATINYLFDLPNNYVVSLLYTTASGCTGKVEKKYAVYRIPKAAFETPTTNVCGNTPVSFTALPPDKYFSYAWNFGDTHSATGAVITHQYQSDSTYSVMLITRSPGGCADTLIIPNYITVLPPFPKIEKVKNTCTGNHGEVLFTQQSKKTETWAWDWGDGKYESSGIDIPTYSHTYSQTGSYKVVLTNTKGACTVKDSVIVQVLIKQNPILTGNKTIVCNTSDQLDISIGGLEANPLGTAEKSYYNISRAEYSDNSVFNGKIQNGDTSYIWKTIFNGGFSGFEKDKTGIRVILKSAGFECEDTTNFIPLDIKWSEAAYRFDANNICFKNNAVFNDLSTTNSEIISWKWEYGDGVTETFDKSKTVTHKFDDPGNYKINLYIKDKYGCTSFSNKDSINIKGPKVNFSAPAISFITLPVLFSNHTNTFGNLKPGYKWEFGNGSSSTEKSPTYIYTNPGNYAVTLTGEETGCADTITRQIIINDFKAAFTIEKKYLSPNNCPPLLVNFTNTSVNYTKIKWDFNDNARVEVGEDIKNNPGHNYVRPGNYIVTLQVWGLEGLYAEAKDSFFVRGPDAELFSDKKEICIGQTVNFVSKTKRAVLYTWDFGNGNLISNSDSTASDKYSLAGKYYTSLAVTDIEGCQYSVKDSIVVRNDPVVTFTPANPVLCQGSSMDITAGGATTYEWIASPGVNSISGATVNVSPQSDANFRIKAADDLGCVNDTEIAVKVILPLNVIIDEVPSTCAKEKAFLNASGAATYQWINNTTGLSNTGISSPTAVNNTPGNYTYTVAGTDAYNCFTDTASISLNILPLPEVHIAGVKDVPFLTDVQLNATFSDDVVKYHWIPDKNLSCTDCPSPTFTMREPSAYTLVVTNGNNCVASAVVTIDFLCKEDVIRIPEAFTPNGDGLNDLFMIKGASTVEWLQIFNRNGNVVFERKNFKAGDTSNGWDGYFKGNPVDAGAYVYLVKIKCYKGDAFIKKGTIVLVR